MAFGGTRIVDMLVGEQLPTNMLENFQSLSTLALLTLGLLFGLKHATEVDHVVAVSTIASEHKNVLRSTLVGALWGIGHTASLLVTGAIVLSLRIAIPEKVSGWLELAVAVMIIALGVSALFRALRNGSKVHVHKHSHDGVLHSHIHFHEAETKHKAAPQSSHSHAVTAIGWKPVIVGSMHGLAGSGALTLLILTQISSIWIGMLYLAVFGVGSVVGMMLISGLIGLPFALTSRNLSSLHHRVQAAAAVLSICFGAWYAYESSAGAGLF